MIINTLRSAKRSARRFIERERPIILMYHRIARVAHDPWQTAVRPDHFAAQIEALVHVRQVVPLRWIASELAQGRVPNKVAAVTFDDGYVDLLAEAKPVLERFGCPATAFLVSGVIGDTHSFWWDELSRLVFETPLLPAELAIEVAGCVHRWRTDGRLPAARSRGVNCSLAVTRAQLHYELWRLLRPLEPDPRRELVGRLCAWVGIEAGANSAHRPLNAEEIRRFASPGFIDIGAHSVTHPVLPLLDESRQRIEIERSRTACEELIGEPIEAFAYPYSEFSAATVACVRRAGFACACTTTARAVSSKDDPMLLPRFGIGDWKGDDLARRLAWGF